MWISNSQRTSGPGNRKLGPFSRSTSTIHSVLESLRGLDSNITRATTLEWRRSTGDSGSTVGSQPAGPKSTGGSVSAPRSS